MTRILLHVHVLGRLYVVAGWLALLAASSLVLLGIGAVSLTIRTPEVAAGLAAAIFFGTAAVALVWGGVPEGTQELALIIADPDAPGGTWYHWVLFNIPADVTALAEGLPREAKLTEPKGARKGLNSWPSENVGYRGPMPPPGHGPHRYYFNLYALDTHIDLDPAQATAENLLAAMKGHVLAEAQTMGTYERKR